MLERFTSRWAQNAKGTNPKPRLEKKPRVCTFSYFMRIRTMATEWPTVDHRSCQSHGQYYYIYNNIFIRHLMLVSNMALQSSADVLPCRSVFVIDTHFRFCRLRMCGDFVSVFFSSSL